MEEFNPREHNRRARLDIVANEGKLIKGDLPGTDAYNDGTDEVGKLVRPGSTSTESGGTYMEDAGPQDSVRREKKRETLAQKPGVRIVGKDQLNDDMYAGEDPTAKWLRENDPNWREKGQDRKAA